MLKVHAEALSFEMTIITKPLSQQEKEKKDETPMEEVSLKRVDVEAPPAARISVITASARYFCIDV